MGTDALRCTGCDINWPVGMTYNLCPGCGEETWPAKERPLTYPEATRRRAELSKAREKRAAAEAAFAAYCAELEARRAELDRDPQAAIAAVIAEAEALTASTA
jgi:hypothetical protein